MYNDHCQLQAEMPTFHIMFNHIIVARLRRKLSWNARQEVRITNFKVSIWRAGADRSTDDVVRSSIDSIVTYIM